ncbi:nucleotidyltransferase domain-containing protein [Sphingomonas sp.]|uniref:nucleotidyltransferase domain-containing protein n=1 Tax=Sphingomonas sp. TaxID=28214 RepID=UPI0038AD7087
MDLSAVRSWLRNELGIANGVTDVHLFGSVLANTATCSDVDCIIVFDRWEVRAAVGEIRARFATEFGRSLHVQMFHESQRPMLSKFLERAAAWESVLE